LTRAQAFDFETNNHRRNVFQCRPKAADKPPTSGARRAGCHCPAKVVEARTSLPVIVTASMTD